MDALDRIKACGLEALIEQINFRILDALFEDISSKNIILCFCSCSRISIEVPTSCWEEVCYHLDDSFLGIEIFNNKVYINEDSHLYQDNDLNCSGGVEWFRKYYALLLKHRPANIKVSYSHYIDSKERKVCKALYQSLLIDQEMENTLNGSNYSPLKHPVSRPRKKKEAKPSSRSGSISTTKAKPSKGGSPAKPRKSAASPKRKK